MLVALAAYAQLPGCAGQGDPCSTTPALRDNDAPLTAIDRDLPDVVDDAVIERLLAGAWSPVQTGELLARTEGIELSANTEHLGPGERACIEHLLAAGELMQRLYEDSLHPQATAIRASLADPRSPRELATIYEMFPVGSAPLSVSASGPGPEFKTVALLATDELPPGKNLYPPDAKRGEIDAFMARQPQARAEILAPRTAVRRATSAAIARGSSAVANRASRPPSP